VDDVEGADVVERGWGGERRERGGEEDATTDETSAPRRRTRVSRAQRDVHKMKAAAKQVLTKMDSPIALVAGVTVGILALGIVVQVLLIVASLLSGKSSAGGRPKRDRKPTTKALEAAPAPTRATKRAPAKKSSSKKASPAPAKAPAKKAAPAKKTSSKAKRAPAKKTSSKGIASPRRSSRTPTRKSR